MPLDEALTLENLSVALTGDGQLSPGRLRLLEGYLALKREFTVELLVACCEKASPVDLDQVGQALYALGDAARWDEGERRWVPQEFALLRRAASAAELPGHVLLIQSLERAFQGMAKWILPHLDSAAVKPWALCAMNALAEKDVQALRQQLPTLLQYGDEQLLNSLAPSSQLAKTCEPHSTGNEPPPSGPPAPEASRAGPPEQVVPILSDSRTGSCQVSPAGVSPPEPVSAAPYPEPEPAVPRASSPPVLEENSGVNAPSPAVQREPRLIPPGASMPEAIHVCTSPCRGSERGPHCLLPEPEHPR